MRHLLVALTLLALQQSDCDPAPQAAASGYTIRVCSQSDVSEIIAYNNAWLSATDIRFALADSDCDVEVIFGGQRADAAADALPLTGRIRIGQFADYRVSFMHEALHLAGVGHEPHDRTSVMFTHAAPDPSITRQLHPHHVEALKRLAGITPFGRVRSQITSARERK